MTDNARDKVGRLTGEKEDGWRELEEDRRGGGGRLHERWKDSEFTATSVTIALAIIIHPMGEIRTIWDELCKYCVGDNRRVELLA